MLYLYTVMDAVRITTFTFCTIPIIVAIIPTHCFSPGHTLTLYDHVAVSPQHTETIIALQSKGTPFIKALKEKQISTPITHLIPTK